MNKLESLHEQYARALGTLADVLDRTPDPGEETIYRDSAIQRFEFCFDLSWKLLKELLRERHGIVCASPKGCLREAYAQQLITDEIAWLKMLEMRNLSTHTYNEETASMIFAALPEARATFEILLPAK
jgi:nucleotidyltransferase substrate binding protein (TIGR01987 family)